MALRLLMFLADAKNAKDFDRHKGEFENADKGQLMWYLSAVSRLDEFECLLACTDLVL